MPVGGTLIYGVVAPGPQLNPVDANTPAERELLSLIWESLLRVDPQNGALRPGLARSWRVSSDGVTVTFDLRDGVLWHDGEPFGTADVVATFGYLMSPASRSPWQISLLAVDNMEQAGDLRVKLTLSEPDCAALYDIGLIPILPTHQLPADPTPDDEMVIVGTGPFRLGEGRMDGGIVLEQNKHYRGDVILDQLIYRPYSSADALRRAWETGKVDVAHFPVGDAGPDDVAADVQSFTYPDNDHVLIVFNLRRGALMNGDVRKALSLALDRESIASQVSPAGATLLSATLLPRHWALEDAGIDLPAYDPAAAGALLSEAGWTDDDGDGVRSKWGNSLALDVITNGENPLRTSTASLVAQSYRLVGVESELQVVEWGIFLDLLFRHDYDIAVISWPFPLDPDQRIFWLSSEAEAGSGFNFGQWKNERVDELLESAAAVPRCDVGKRAELYGQFARLMIEDHPVEPLFVPHQRLLAVAGVSGIDPSPFAGSLWNAYHWRVAHP